MICITCEKSKKSVECYDNKDIGRPIPLCKECVDILQRDLIDSKHYMIFANFVRICGYGNYLDHVEFLNTISELRESKNMLDECVEKYLSKLDK